MTTIACLRWPAFYASDIQTHESDIIGPAQWHGMLPGYGTVTGANSVTCAADQATMDMELEQAWRCGIDIFFYDFACNVDSYPFGTGPTQLNEAIRCHLASPKAGLVKIGLILLNAHFPDNPWNTVADRIVSIMQSPHYYKFANSPLMMIFDTTNFATSPGAAGLTTLQTKATAAGLGTIYIATCNPDNTTDTSPGVAGIQFISRYTYGFGSGSAEISQASYLSIMQGIWATQIGNPGGNGVIPCLSVGWDIRARVDSGYWCSQIPGYACASTDHTADITPQQWANHVQAAVNVVQANPAVCNFDMVFINGWDEYTEEGGCIGPHLGDGGMRLQFQAKQLLRQREPARNLRANGIQRVNL